MKLILLALSASILATSAYAGDLKIYSKPVDVAQLKKHETAVSHHHDRVESAKISTIKAKKDKAGPAIKKGIFGHGKKKSPKKDRVKF